MNNATKSIRLRLTRRSQKSTTWFLCWLNYSVYLIADAIQQGVNNSTDRYNYYYLYMYKIKIFIK